MSAASFDQSGRRLILGFDAGHVMIFNFSNGQAIRSIDTVIRRCRHPQRSIALIGGLVRAAVLLIQCLSRLISDAQSEISAIAYVEHEDDENKFIMAAGWDRQV